MGKDKKVKQPQAEKKVELTPLQKHNGMLAQLVKQAEQEGLRFNITHVCQFKDKQ